ncbi:MAG: hypothetical protein EOP09_17930 [Proteobacteria bacterium]|nr:MAG: hypothetical protein EOP09_17930 [Pseudomonadota bacterium]
MTETLLASERSAFHSVTTTTSAIKVRLTAGFKISPPPIGVSEGITPVVSETVLETYTICVTEIDD